MPNVPGFSCFRPLSSVSVAKSSPVFVGGCVCSQHQQTQPQQKFSILIQSVQLFILILQCRQRWGGSSEYVCLARSSIHSPLPFLLRACLHVMALYLIPTSLIPTALLSLQVPARHQRTTKFLKSEGGTSSEGTLDLQQPVLNPHPLGGYIMPFTAHPPPRQPPRGSIFWIF